MKNNNSAIFPRIQKPTSAPIFGEGMKNGKRAVPTELVNYLSKIIRTIVQLNNYHNAPGLWSVDRGRAIAGKNGKTAEGWQEWSKIANE